MFNNYLSVLHRKVSNNRKRVAAVALIIAASSFLIEEPARRQRRWWVRPWLEDKQTAGLKLVNKEFKEDPEQFKQFIRMNEQSFNKLLDRLKPQLEKSNTNFRDAISARDKLIVTLRFLATGETYRSLMYTFRISESTISLFVPDVCSAIYNTLKHEFLKVKVEF